MLKAFVKRDFSKLSVCEGSTLPVGRDVLFDYLNK